MKCTDRPKGFWSRTHKALLQNTSIIPVIHVEGEMWTCAVVSCIVAKVTEVSDRLHASDLFLELLMRLSSSLTVLGIYLSCNLKLGKKWLTCVTSCCV